MTLGSKITRGSVARRASGFFALGALFLVALAALGLSNRVERVEEGWQHTETLELVELRANLQGFLEPAMLDLLVLARSPELFERSPDSDARLLFLLRRQLETKEHFLQGRLLDLDGREVIRVERGPDGVVVTPPDSLQDKGHRAYFRRSVQLPRDHVFLGRLDLNREHGAIQRPLRPVVRLAAPAFDGAGNRRGVVVLNYDARHLLGHLLQYQAHRESEVMLLDQDGYWLHSPTPADAWGRDLGTGRTLDLRFDGASEILETERGIVRHPEGLFVVDTVALSLENVAGARVTQEDRAWKLVSFLPRAVSWGWVESSLRVEEGILIALLAILFPLSWGWARLSIERRRSRSVLSAFEHAFEHGQDLVCLTDPRGRIVYVNPAFEETTGYPTSEVLGETPSFLQSGEHHVSLYEDLWRTIAGGQSFSTVLSNRRKDGSIYQQATTIRPVMDRHGTIEGYLAVGVDLSARAKAHERVHDVLRRTFGSMAHHINNVLTSILILASQVESDPKSDLSRESKEDLDTAIEEVQRITRLIGRLTTYNVEVGRPVEVALGTFLDELVEATRGRVPETITVAASGRRAERVHLHAGAVTLAVEQLVENAVEAMPESGRLHIEMAHAIEPRSHCDACGQALIGEWLLLTIRDTGAGMDDASRRLASSAFHSDKPDVDEVAQRLGLGLTIAEGIVHELGGHLRIESAKDEGTAVTLALPWRPLG